MLKRYFEVSVQHVLDDRMRRLPKAIAAGGPIVTTSRPLHLIEFGWRKRGGDGAHADPLGVCLANQVELIRAVRAADLELHLFEFDSPGAEAQRNTALARLLGVDTITVEWPNFGASDYAPGQRNPVRMHR